MRWDEDATVDTAHPLPLTPEYQRQLQSCRPVLDAAAPDVTPSAAPPVVHTYCRAPCRLKMMSLLDSELKHTCTVAASPHVHAHVHRPLSALSAAAAEALHSGQPCVAPCPLKLTSMLHGGAKHVCVQRPPAPAPAPASKENRDPLGPDDRGPQPGLGSYLEAGRPPRHCGLDLFPHLVDDCDACEGDEDITRSPATTASSYSPESVASIASADGALETRMTGCTSSSALRARSTRRRSMRVKRTPSNASTRSDFVVNSKSWAGTVTVEKKGEDEPEGVGVT
ncbi:Chromatin-remodeling ATPase INO80 [Frankliniella fusca]|uniref:Chromatin-remodeling ATPase INO80 n=1 Tax=Frankliniella fusca TaxID=407009 RepID=A0AAE1LTH2_9NEOP|nr:Chromatin-remodeling ATPase INO80 [Frankliniella fusca]